MQEMIRELGTSFDEVLAVIQNEQQLFGAPIIRDGVDEPGALEFMEMERGSDGWFVRIGQQIAGQC